MQITIDLDYKTFEFLSSNVQFFKRDSFENFLEFDYSDYIENKMKLEEIHNKINLLKMINNVYVKNNEQAISFMKIIGEVVYEISTLICQNKKYEKFQSHISKITGMMIDYDLLKEDESDHEKKESITYLVNEIIPSSLYFIEMMNDSYNLIIKEKNDIDKNQLSIINNEIIENKKKKGIVYRNSHIGCETKNNSKKICFWNHYGSCKKKKCKLYHCKCFAIYKQMKIQNKYCEDKCITYCLSGKCKDGCNEINHCDCNKI